MFWLQIEIGLLMELHYDKEANEVSTRLAFLMNEKG